jgi:Putative beta-barrel porin 2
MKFQHRSITAAAVMAAVIAIPQARALVSLEDGKDNLFIDGTLEMAYDSNVFTNSRDQGSMEYEGTLAANFTRRAGWIGVNATASVDFARFASFQNQDYVDPKLTVELTKESGRTTGSLTATVQREDRADVDVNTRDVSWNYDAGLNIQYPVIERYSISGTLDYGRADYLDQTLFTNQDTYAASLYLYYILNDQRDLFVQYRERYTEEARGPSELDRALSAGVSGNVVGPFNGSLEVGYQNRKPTSGPDAGGYDDLTASGKVTWNMNRRMNLTANVSRDFSTDAEAQSIDATEAGLTFQDSFTSKASTTLMVSTGENRFLGADGLVAPGGRRRVDTYAEFSAAYFYTLNEHLKASINYVYYRNWSTLPFADFPRQEIILTLATHW